MLRPPGLASVGDPVALVRAAPFQHALLDVIAFLLVPAPAPAVADPGNAGDSANAKPTDVIGGHLDKLHARLKRDAHRFDELDELERHGVRKRLKRLRYLGELVAPLYRGGRVGRFLEQLEPAQDELGHYMDLSVALRLAHDVIDAGDARAWFNVGWLKAQQPRTVGRCAKALRKVAAARPFWR